MRPSTRKKEGRRTQAAVVGSDLHIPGVGQGAADRLLAAAILVENIDFFCAAAGETAIYGFPYTTLFRSRAAVAKSAVQGQRGGVGQQEKTGVAGEPAAAAAERQG